MVIGRLHRGLFAGLVAAATALVGLPGWSPTARSLSLTDTASVTSAFDEHDVDAYIELFSVDRATALQQLALQEAVAHLDTSALGDNFAGMAISREGGFHLDVYATAPPPKAFTAKLGAAGLGDVAQVHQVSNSAQDLLDVQARVRRSAFWEDRHGQVASMIDVSGNRVVLLDGAGDSSLTGLDLPSADLQKLRVERPSAGTTG